MIEHLLHEWFPAWMIHSRLDFFAKVLMVCSLEADVGEVAPTGGVMTDLDFGIEGFRFTVPDGLDEIGLVPSSSVSFELFDQFAIAIEGFGRSALAFESTCLAIDDISA